MDAQFSGVSWSGQLRFVWWNPIFSASLLWLLSLHTKMRISFHVPSRKTHITVRFGGHSTVVGLHCGVSVMLSFWRLEFGGGSQIFGIFVDSWVKDAD